MTFEAEYLGPDRIRGWRTGTTYRLQVLVDPYNRPRIVYDGYKEHYTIYSSWASLWQTWKRTT